MSKFMIILRLLGFCRSCICHFIFYCSCNKLVICMIIRFWSAERENCIVEKSKQNRSLFFLIVENVNIEASRKKISTIFYNNKTGFKDRKHFLKAKSLYQSEEILDQNAKNFFVQHIYGHYYILTNKRQGGIVKRIVVYIIAIFFNPPKSPSRCILCLHRDQLYCPKIGHVGF